MKAVCQYFWLNLVLRTINIFILFQYDDLMLAHSYIIGIDKRTLGYLADTSTLLNIQNIYSRSTKI